MVLGGAATCSSRLGGGKNIRGNLQPASSEIIIRSVLNGRDREGAQHIHLPANPIQWVQVRLY